MGQVARVDAVQKLINIESRKQGRQMEGKLKQLWEYVDFIN